MRISRAVARLFRGMALVAAGGGLYILSACNDEVRTAVLTQTATATTSILNALITALVNSITGQSSATSSAEAVLDHLQVWLA
jgi:hypothetical protein